MKPLRNDVMEISYKPTKDADSKTVNIKFEMADLSEESVMALAEDAAIVRIQARFRIHEQKLADGKEDKLPKDWAEFLKPKERMSKIAKLRSAYSDLSDEEKKALLAELTAK